MGVLKLSPPISGVETVLLGVLLDAESASAADLLKAVRSHDCWGDYSRELIWHRMNELLDRGYVAKEKISTRRVVYRITEQGKAIRRMTVDFFRSV